MHHRVLERSQEVLLELEVRKLFLFKEPHGKLSQVVQSEERDMGIVVTAHLRILREDAKEKGRIEIHTWLKCSPRISQRFDHSRRIRFML